MIGSTCNSRTRMVSQPNVTEAIFVMIVSAVLKISPFQLYGNSFSQTVSCKVSAMIGSTCNSITRMVSQPNVTEAIFVMIVSAVLKISPFQVYGNSFSQTVSCKVSAMIGSTCNSITRMVSQPNVTEAIFVMIVSAVLKISPFQVYGNSFSQTVSCKVSAMIGSTCNSRTRMVSQPNVTEAIFVMIVSAVLKISPFQLYGNSFSQTVSCKVSAMIGSTCNSRTRMVSQP